MTPPHSIRRSDGILTSFHDSLHLARCPEWIADAIHVADSFQGYVKVIDATSGATLGTIGTFGELQGQLSLPSAMVLDPFNRLYIASPNNHRVELFGLDSFLHLISEPSSEAVASGSNLVLKAITGGPGPFSYQWVKDSTLLVDGALVAGATNDTLTINTTGESDGGSYSVVVVGPSQTLTSGTTRIVMQTAPSVYGDPQSQTVLTGEPVQLSVGASGTALTYQWQLNGLDIPGATNDTLLLAEAQIFNAGSYTAFVKNNVGAVSSSPASLTVLTPPLVMEILSLAFTPDLSPVLTINSDLAKTYSIDASSNLADWDPITTFVNNSGILEISDGGATNYLQRFYRVRWIP